MWYVYNMKYYSQRKEDSPITCIIIVQLEILLGEIGQAHTGESHVLSLICGIYKVGLNEVWWLLLCCGI